MKYVLILMGRSLFTFFNNLTRGGNMKKELIKILFFSVICISLFVSTASASTISGWKYDNGNWHCKNEEGTYIINSWLYDNGKWYYLDCYGRMFVGWHKDFMPSSMYYSNYSGKLSRCDYGKVIPSKWYNFSDSGDLIGSADE